MDVDMEKFLCEIKKVFKFKENTAPGDIVLLVMENPHSMIYALVQDIERDDTRKDEWWHVKMQMLVFPPREMTWTLREEQFTGSEVFMMGGDRRFMKALELGVSEKGTIGGEGKKGVKSGLRIVK